MHILMPTGKYRFHTTPRKLFLWLIENIKESCSWSNCRAKLTDWGVNSSHLYKTIYIYMQNTCAYINKVHIHKKRFRKNHGKQDRKVAWARSSECFLPTRQCLQITTGKLHHEISALWSISQTYTMSTPVDMPTCLGKFSWKLTPRWRTTSKQWMIRKGKLIFSKNKPFDRLTNLRGNAGWGHVSSLRIQDGISMM